MNDLHHQWPWSRSSKVKVKLTFLVIFQWIFIVLTSNKSHPFFCEWPAPLKVKVIQGHPRSPKVKVKLTFLSIFQWIFIVLTSNKSHSVCVNDLHLWMSRSSKVTQGQGEIDIIVHISMNIHRIDFKRKVCVNDLQHRRSWSKVKVIQGQRSNWYFLTIFQHILIIWHTGAQN